MTGPVSPHPRPWVYDAGAGGTAFLLIGLTLLVLALGIMFGVTMLPPGPWHKTSPLLGRLLVWDAGWYENIAANGYSWDPVAASKTAPFQPVAFFPLYPVIERLIIRLTGSSAAVLMILPDALCGFASIPVFLSLARRLLPEPDAMRAALLYALYPAASFFIMGYPTGVMNLLIMLSLLDIIDRRRWRSAFWCGLGTAAGPLFVFVAVVLCCDQGIPWIRRRGPVRDLPSLIGFGLLSVWGMIAYIVYQADAFGHPFAFLSAQDAWGQAPHLVRRLQRLLTPHWYLGGILTYSLRSLYAFGTLRITQTGNYAFEILLGKLSVLAAMLGIVVSFRLRPLVIPFSGLAVLVGYLWFIDTVQNATAAMRLIYPALPMFMGAALLLGRMPASARAGVLGLSAILLAVNTGLVVAGYWVV